MKNASPKNAAVNTGAVLSPAARLRYFEERKDEIVDVTRQFVEIESPSNLKQAVDRLSTIVRSRFEEIGGKVKVHPQKTAGNHVQIDFPGNQQQKPVLVLGHMDTVYSIGAISKMPCRVNKGRLSGPGVLDMKAGIALVYAAMQALREWHKKRLPRPVQILLVSDEETGSQTSRALTEALAKKSAAVLVAEPAYGLQGAVKTARKGVGQYTLKVAGKAAHSGLDFEKGASAIIELSRQVIEISRLVDLERGTTLNAGTTQGGGRVNVVPAEASAIVDVRVTGKAEAADIDRKLRSLRPFDPQCRLEITGGMNRPPMERSAGTSQLYEKARAIAAQLGWDLEEAAVGGGSDGNFTAALGIPTLDGLGAVGEGAHSSGENIVIDELPRRAALLAALIEWV